jgi:hypothetical protein
MLAFNVDNVIQASASRWMGVGHINKCVSCIHMQAQKGDVRIIFFHVHKAAGSSFCALARAAGLRTYLRNCNVPDADEFTQERTFATVALVFHLQRTAAF